jgi:hypothetical protein
MGLPMYRQIRTVPFAATTACVLHEIWPMLVEVAGRKRLATEARRLAHVRDEHQDDADQKRDCTPAARSGPDRGSAAAAAMAGTPHTQPLSHG